MNEYDPLDYDNLARSVVNALLSAVAAPLPPDRFEGAGVYAIYYRGPLDYAPDDGTGGEAAICGKGGSSGRETRRRKRCPRKHKAPPPTVEPACKFHWSGE